MKPNTNTTVESLLAKTKLMPNGCMEWQPSRDRGGYGYYMIMYKNLRAHRVMAELVYGPRPEGMVVRHSCDNPPCINPDHLSFGTHKDNVADKFARGRANIPFGESHAHSKLTAESVLAIRAEYGSGISYDKLGAKYGISGATARDAIKRITWKHI